mmetsp:Transcript_60948/g.108290  ORF Transcript_60948/g.108290 Transcript_60948/m.108290 type:complete len:204 (+) Transcript_60948:488-1099(+)
MVRAASLSRHSSGLKTALHSRAEMAPSEMSGLENSSFSRPRRPPKERYHLPAVRVKERALTLRPSEFPSTSLGRQRRSVPISEWKVNCVSGGEKTWTETAGSESEKFVKSCMRTEHSSMMLAEPSASSFFRSTSLSQGKSPGAYSWCVSLPCMTFIHIFLPRPTVWGGTFCPGLQHVMTTEKSSSQCMMCCTGWNSLKWAGLA